MPTTATPARPYPEPPSPIDRRALGVRLRSLPLRAAVAFAARCAQRVRVLDRLAELLPDAYAAGLEAGRVRWLPPSDAPASAARASAARAPAEVAGHAAEAAVRVDRVAGPDGVTARAILTDLDALDRLGLGRPGEPGEPVRWNDPRLGPLWPDGPPAWHAEAEQQCRRLDDELRGLPDPTQPPLPQAELDQLEDWAWLHDLYGRGELGRYQGRYVFAAHKTIFAHGRNRSKTRPRAERQAAKEGVPPDRLVDYYVPSPE